MSVSRVGERFSGGRRRRISGFHSGIFCLRDAIDASHELPPAAKLRGKDSAALASHTIITAAALSAFFNPAALQPSASFQAVEHLGERGPLGNEGGGREVVCEVAGF